MMRTSGRPVWRRLLLLGPGTIAALGVGGYLVAAGILSRKPPADPFAGRVVYEADASGKLRRIEAGRSRHVRAHLWKPEPGMLLSLQSALHLSKSQIKQLTAIDGAWMKQKAALMQAMERSADRVRSIGHASAGQITAALQDYSAVSREFDTRRQFAWQMATGLLNPEQMQNLRSAVKRGSFQEKHHD